MAQQVFIFHFNRDPAAPGGEEFGIEDSDRCDRELSRRISTVGEGTSKPIKGTHHAKADFRIVCYVGSNIARVLICTSTRARIQAKSRFVFEGGRLDVAGVIEVGYSLASCSIFDSLELHSSIPVIGLLTKESWCAIESVPGSRSLAETFPE
jgi:hypothetical protein